MIGEMIVSEMNRAHSKETIKYINNHFFFWKREKNIPLNLITYLLNYIIKNKNLNIFEIGKAACYINY